MDILESLHTTASPENSINNLFIKRPKKETKKLGLWTQISFELQPIPPHPGSNLNCWQIIFGITFFRYINLDVTMPPNQVVTHVPDV